MAVGGRPIPCGAKMTAMHESGDRYAGEVRKLGACFASQPYDLFLLQAMNHAPAAFAGACTVWKSRERVRTSSQNVSVIPDGCRVLILSGETQTLHSYLYR